jgi:hypothetical protein
MKPDLYTKAVLTVIAIMLTAIACNPYISPKSIVQAQSAFAGVQYSDSAGYPSFFDPRTGDVWEYGIWGDKAFVKSHFKIAKPGAGGTVELPTVPK